MMIAEAAYPSNIGFTELVQFYKVADDSQIKKMQKAIEDEDWQEFKRIIKDAIGVALH
jgi:hypothetical protein